MTETNYTVDVEPLLIDEHPSLEFLGESSLDISERDETRSSIAGSFREERDSDGTDGNSSDDFTTKFWNLLSNKNVKIQNWKNFIAEFTNEAACIVQEIIHEKQFFKNTQKHLKQIENNENDQKFLIKGLTIEFIGDTLFGDKGYLYGGDEPNNILAWKKCNNDSKGWTHLFATIDQSMSEFLLPFQCYVDYAGYRLQISSAIDATKGELIYGVDKNTKTAHFSQEVHEKMLKIAEILNLKEHTIQDNKIALCYDLEVLKSDQKLVVLDYTRLFPPQAPIKGQQTNMVSHFLRPELLKKVAMPLSSDVFSSSASNENNSHVISATKFLVIDTINKFIEELVDPKVNKKYITSFEKNDSQEPLIDAMHSRGINIRHLGTIWVRMHKVKHNNHVLMSYIITLIVVRSVKNIWRKRIQERTPQEAKIIHTSRKHTEKLLNEITHKSSKLAREILSEIQRVFGSLVIEHLQVELGKTRKQLDHTLWEFIDFTIVIHKFTNLCGIVLTNDTKNKLRQYPEISFTSSDIVNFVPIVKYPTVLNFYIGCYWLEKGYKTNNKILKIEYFSEAVKKFQMLPSYTKYNEKYFEAMINLIEISPYSPLCEISHTISWLTKRFLLNMKDPNSHELNGKNIILDLLLCLCVKSRDQDLKKSLDLLLAEKLVESNINTIHPSFLQHYISGSSSSFLAKLYEKSKNVVEEFASNLLRAATSQNRLVLQQVLKKFPIAANAHLCLVMAQLSSENVLNQFNFASISNELSPLYVENFLKQILSKISSRQEKYSEEIFSLLKTLSLITDVTENVKVNIVKSLIILSEDYRMLAETNQQDVQRFGWKFITETTSLNSMWFYLIKLINISSNPIHELKGILKFSLNFTTINTTLFLSLFEVILFLLISNKTINDKSGNFDVMNEEFRSYALLYSNSMRNFLQSNYEKFSRTKQEEWKEGFVELSQYVLFLLPELGLSIIQRLFKSFCTADPVYGQALLQVVTSFPGKIPPANINQLKEEFDSIIKTLPKIDSTQISVPIFESENEIKVVPKSCDKWTLVQFPFVDEYVISELTEETLVGAILNSFPKLEYEETHTKWLSEILQIFFRKKSQNEYLNFLRILISHVPYTYVLENSLGFGLRHNFLPFEIDRQSDAFKQICMKYVGLIKKKSDKFVKTLKEFFDVSWLKFFLPTYEQLSFAEFDGRILWDELFHSLQKTYFGEIHYSLMPKLFSQFREFFLWENNGETLSCITHLIRTECFEALCSISFSSTLCVILNESKPDDPLLPYLVSFCLEKGFDKDAMNELGRTPLHVVAERGLTSIASLLIEKGANIESIDKDGKTPLHWAVTCGHASLVSLLVEKGANKEQLSMDGKTPLHYAVASGQSSIVSLLIESGSRLEGVDESGNTPLHIAAETGQYAIASLLIERNAFKDAVNKHGKRPINLASENGDNNLVTLLIEKGAFDEEGNYPIHNAAKSRNVEDVRRLLDKGVDINARNIAGITPLQFAYENNNNDVIFLLIKQGATGVDNLVDEQGTIALHLAAHKGQADIVALLLNKGANKDATNLLGWSPLHYATSEGHIDVVKLLIEKEANKNASNLAGSTALHIAAQNGHIDVVSYLLEIGLTNIPNQDGKRPTELAAEEGFRDIVLLLIEKGALHEDGNLPIFNAAKNGDLYTVKFLLENSGDVNSANKDGKTMLHVAAEKGHIAITEFLLDNNANHDARLDDGKTPLHLAAENGFDTVSLLIEKGASKDAVTKTGYTSLHFATENAHISIVSYLISLGANIEAVDTLGKTPLHIAAEKGIHRVVSILIEKGANKEAIDKFGCTPLYLAAQNGHTETVLILIEKGANKDAATPTGWTPLHKAILSGSESCVALLVSKGANKNAIDFDGETPLHYAVKTGQISLVAYLLENGAFKEAMSQFGWTPLYHAVVDGHDQIVTLLIEKGANKEAVSPKTGKTPLHIAVEKGHINIVSYLLENGCNKEALDKEGKTPFFCAVESGNEPLVAFLLQNGVNKETPDKERELTPLHLAASTGNASIIRLLLEHGAIIESVDKTGSTPLQYAAVEGHTDIVALFIDKGANKNAVNKFGRTALHLATRDGHKFTMSFLFEQGCNKHAIDEFGYTPLHYAAERGHKDAVSLLIEKGKTDPVDKNGCTPLHLAAKHGHKDIASLLIDKGSNKDAAADKAKFQDTSLTSIVSLIRKNSISQLPVKEIGKTPLHFAAQSGHFSVVAMLIDKGVNIEPLDEESKTPLHYAAFGGHSAIVSLLIDKGANFELGDYAGSTALQFAAVQGRIDTVLLLIDKGCNKDATNKNGRAAIHFACRGGHKETVSLLVEKGVALNLPDGEFGFTALHYAADKGFKEIAQLLIEKGASKDIQDKTGKTPQQVAIEKGHYDMVDILQ